MMNQLDIIENDLKALQAETKKKFNTIKDVENKFIFLLFAQAVNESMTAYTQFKDLKNKDNVGN